jgi:hypothetical protein
VGALSLLAGSTFVYEINSSLPFAVGADLVNVALGGVALIDTTGAGVTLSVSDLAATPIADISPGVNFDAPAAGTGFNYVTLTAVPEASAVLFGGLICLVIGITYGGRKFVAGALPIVSAAYRNG